MTDLVVRNTDEEAFSKEQCCYIKKKEVLIALSCITLFTGAFALMFGLSFIPRINKVFSKISKIPFTQIVLKVFFSSAGGAIPVVVLLLGIGANARKNRKKISEINPFREVDPNIMGSFQGILGSKDHPQIASHIVSFSNNPNFKLVSKVFQEAWRNVKGELIIGRDNYLEKEIPKNLQHVIISRCKEMCGKEDDADFVLWFYENCSNASRVTIRDFFLDIIFYRFNFFLKQGYLIKNLLEENRSCKGFNFFRNLPNLQVLTCKIGMFPEIFEMKESYQPQWELARELKAIRLYVSSKCNANHDEMKPYEDYVSFGFALIINRIQGIVFLKFRSENPCFLNLEVIEIRNVKIKKEEFFRYILSILQDSLEDGSDHPLKATSCTIQEVEEFENQVIVHFVKAEQSLKVKFYF